MTKLDMAKRITKQLYVMDDLPAVGHHHVRKLMQKSKAELAHFLHLAKRAEAASAAGRPIRDDGKICWECGRDDARLLTTVSHMRGTIHVCPDCMPKTAGALVALKECANRAAQEKEVAV